MEVLLDIHSDRAVPFDKVHLCKNYSADVNLVGSCNSDTPEENFCCWEVGVVVHWTNMTLHRDYLVPTADQIVFETVWI